MFNEFPPPPNRAVYELMWEKYCTAGHATDDNITGHMRLPYWMTKATDTHPEYIIFIPFPLHQWLRERPSILHLYTYCIFVTP